MKNKIYICTAGGFVRKAAFAKPKDPSSFPEPSWLKERMDSHELSCPLTSMSMLGYTQIRSINVKILKIKYSSLW